jgi:VWFA-related protein
MSELRLACFSLLVSVPMFACAQQSGSLVGLPTPTPRIPVRSASDTAEGLIKLDVVLTDKSGKPISGIEDKDFTLLDNGQPNKILSFEAFDGVSAKPDPPVEVILVIDAANHSSDEVSDELHGVDKFLRQNNGHLAQPVSIYRLSNEGLSVTSQSSTDGNALAAEISQKGALRDIAVGSDDQPFNVTMAARSPSFRNPSYHPQSSLRALGSIVLIERRNPGRKLLVWISPSKPFGENLFEWVTEFSTRIREARITLFSVEFWKNLDRRPLYENFMAGVQSAVQSKADNLLLQVLAMQSGGRVVQEPDNDLARLIGKCTNDASTFYTISFDPPPTNQPDEYHDLKVEVAMPELIAGTNTGYYDQPTFYNQPFVPAERVTVEQLEQVIEKAHGKSDAELGRQLSGIELTERLSTAKLLAWKERLRGGKAWAALVAVADASAFSDPPADEIPARAPPDLPAQRLMLSKTVDYLLTTIPTLPDFFAVRTTAAYEEPAIKDGQTWKTTIGDRSLRWAGNSSSTVLYRNGYEVVDLGPVKEKKRAKQERTLNTKGTFGPILSVVILDAARSDLVWSRWEPDAGGILAVFRYKVPWEQSHYEVAYRGIQTDGNGIEDFHQLIGYHGDIAIDPASGAIMRMTIEGDLNPRLPILRSSILVEYGPVAIGGTSRNCLLRSASIARIRTIFNLYEWGESLRVYGPYETMLDDVAFREYHMFRGETRVLPGYDPSQTEK